MKIKKHLQKLFILLLFLPLTACFDVSLTVRVKKDGSGEIIENFLFTREFLLTMVKLQQSFKKKLNEGMKEENPETPDAAPSGLPEPDENKEARFTEEETPPLARREGAEKESKSEESEKEDDELDPDDPQIQALEEELRNKMVDDFRQKRAEFESKAEKMGEGVTLLSLDGVKMEDGRFGYKAVYHFDDVRKLKLKDSPVLDEKKMGPGLPGAEESKEKDLVFQFIPGNPASLKVLMDRELNNKKEGDESADSADEESDTDDNPASEDALKMFKNMRMAFYVEVDGKIVKSNATFQEGSKITLMDMQFEELLKNKETLKMLKHKKPNSAEEMQEMMKKVPGIKIEVLPEIEIKFE